MNPHTRSHLYVILAFFATATAVTFPLAFVPWTGIPYGGDAFQFLWNGWWFAKAAGNPDLAIWYTTWQYAPNGTSLALHDLSPLNAMLLSILRVPFGDFASYNVLIIFHYILGAWGAYILAWYLTGNRPASVIAGVIYGFSVHHAMHLAQLSTVSSGWLPLSVYYLIKYTRDGGWRDGAFSLLMLLAAALSSWYHFVFAGVVFFGLMILAQIRKLGLAEHLSGFKKWQRAVLPWLAAVFILSPYLINAWLEAAKQPVEWRVEIGNLYFLDPVWAILPPPDHPIFGALTRPLGGIVPGNVTEGVASLGLIAIALGIGAWFRKNPATRVWCWLGLILFLLAMGPVLTIAGQNLHVPLPFKLWSMVPGLNLVRVPARFVGPFTLTLAISAAGFIAGLGSEWKEGVRRKLLLYAVPTLIIFETLVAPVTMAGSELNHPALSNLRNIYQEETGDPYKPDLLVNFPTLPERTQFSYQQTLHGIPMLDGALSNPPPGARDFLYKLNWKPEYLKSIGVDIVLYQPWAAKTSLGEFFYVEGRQMEPLEFFQYMGYTAIYEDENIIVMAP